MRPRYVEWNGQRWYKNKRDGYYRNRRGKLCRPACRFRHYKATGRLVFEPDKGYWRKPDHAT